MNESVWLYPSIGEKAKTLSVELGIPVEIAQILINRKIINREDVHDFLYGSLDNLKDPFLLSGMKDAVDRIQKACSRGEKILIFGDYDVDGVLSVVMLIKALQTIGGNADYFIPDRLSQGYGIKEGYMDIVLARKAQLIISVDCGIKAVDFVNRARKHGVDVIITDHHLPGDVLPQAHAVLNPLISGSNYPDKHLAGIGVVFKLVQALFEENRRASVLPHYLKLVSIGTIADVAALRGENRLFVKFGLKGLEDVSNPGLKDLLDACRLSKNKVTVGDVGFRIGPRINAAGRLGKADLAVRLFLSEDTQECRELVRDLDRMNAQRQKLEEKIYTHAIRTIKKKSLTERYKLLVLGCETWHRGVIGIVASKLKDLYHRPVILFVLEDGKAFGSGRSIKEFSLIDCLDENNAHFINYGGHPLAVGCELFAKNLGAFRSAVNEFCWSRLSEGDLKRKIAVDALLPLDQIDSRFLDCLSLLSPFGVGNPKPVFLTEEAEVIAEPQKLKGRHCKFLVKQAGRIFEAMGWGRSDWAEEIHKGERVDLAYSIQISEYLGEERTSLFIEDIKKSR